jgi:hypothetical protein
MRGAVHKRAQVTYIPLEVAALLFELRFKGEIA